MSAIVLLILKKAFTFIIYCMCGRAEGTCPGLCAVVRGQLVLVLSSTLWVSGFYLRSSALVASTFTC